MLSGCRLHVIKLVAVHGRCAKRTDFSDLDKFMERFHCFFDRGVIVKTVYDVKVKIIGAKSCECLVDFPRDRFF